MRAKLLIVCYYPLLCQLRQAIFQQFGCEVLTAGHLGAALQLVAGNRVQLVLLSSTVPFADKRVLAMAGQSSGARVVSICETGDEEIDADCFVNFSERPEVIVKTVLSALDPPRIPGP